MIYLSEEFVVSKFFQYTYTPKHNRYNNTYQGGCCICREGGSIGKKRRCYYIPKNDNIYCHNCGWSSKPFNWIKEVSGKSEYEIIKEAEEYNPFESHSKETEIKAIRQEQSLPKDSINLFDKNQTDFYTETPIVEQCLNLIVKRRLNTAVNRPQSLFVSLVDRVHKNRLVIPFYNEIGDIEFYQTRTVLEQEIKTKPKYLSKINSEKTLFNINNITNNTEFVYVFEGPINAFFTRNSVAVAGITEKGTSFTPRQTAQFQGILKWYTRVWVLDSQWIDDTAFKKSEALLKDGEKVFIWPEEIGKRFKDFNDICVAGKRDEIKEDFIQNNTFENLEGIIRLAYIKKNR